MATAAQILANQANSQLSTGPRTTEGRTRSANNALKHGLASDQLIVRGDETQLFAETKAELLASLAPQGAAEMAVFNDILRARWNMERIQRLECDLFDGLNDPLQNEANAAQLDRLERYYTRWERTFYRAMKELRQLHTDRAMRQKPFTESKANIPALASGPVAILRTQFDLQNEIRIRGVETWKDVIRKADEQVARDVQRSVEDWQRIKNQRSMQNEANPAAPARSPRQART